MDINKGEIIINSNPKKKKKKNKNVYKYSVHKISSNEAGSMSYHKECHNFKVTAVMFALVRGLNHLSNNIKGGKILYKHMGLVYYS